MADAVAADEIRKQIEAIYHRECPDKIPSLPQLFKKFDGKEVDLLKKVKAKYTGDPTAKIEQQLVRLWAARRSLRCCAGALARSPGPRAS